MNVPEKLLKACIKEDRRAQSELYRHCFGVMMGICMRYLKDEQEAVAALNQSFLKVLKGLEKRNPKAPFEAWLRRLTINTVIDEYRRNKKFHAHIQVEDFSEGSGYTHSLDFNEADRRLDAEEIERLIQALPPVTQQVFNLYAIDGYSHREIAKMLEMSEGTSKWHVSTARSRLKEQMAHMINYSEKTKL